MTLQRMEHTGAAPQTTLQAQMGAADGSFTVVSGANYPTGAVGPFIIAVDPGLNGEEKIRCSSRSGNTFTVATLGRGYDNTTPGIHTQGANVQHVLGSIEVDDDNEHIYNTARDDHTHYSRTDGTRAFTGGVTINAGGLTVTGNETLTGNETVSGTITAGAATTGLTVVASGLTGATAASRYVGATASGAPLTGTFAVGDFVIDQSGTVWICTTAGTPGTWTTLPKDAAVVHIAGTETVTGAKTFSANTAVGGTLNVTGAVTGLDFVASGLTGAVAASRYCGATASGAPTTGTFALGDFVIDQGGSVWICTTAGTPGVWTPAGQSLFGAENPLVGTLPVGTVRFLRQKGVKSSTSDGVGNGNILFKNAFPNGLLHVSVDVDFFGTAFPWKLAYGGAPTKSSVGYNLFNTSTGAAVINTAFSYFYDATGW